MCIYEIENHYPICLNIELICWMSDKAGHDIFIFFKSIFHVKHDHITWYDMLYHSIWHVISYHHDMSFMTSYMSYLTNITCYYKVWYWTLFGSSLCICLPSLCVMSKQAGISKLVTWQNMTCPLKDMKF